MAEGSRERIKKKTKEGGRKERREEGSEGGRAVKGGKKR